MKNKLLRFLSVALTVLLCSCDYQFSEDYYKDIELTEPSGSVSLINFNNGETLRDGKNVNYRYSGQTRNNLYEIQFYIDDTLIKTYTKTNGSFFIDIKNLKDGKHNLKVEYYFKTNSGSLAEITGAESYVKVENFSFTVNKTAIPLEIERVELANGTIFVHIEDYLLTEEIGKTLSSSLIIYDEEDRIIGQLEVTKDDIESGVINDNISLDFNLRYVIRIENSFGYVDSAVKEINIPDTFNLEVPSTANGAFHFKWTNYPLYNNIKRALLVYDKYSFRKEVSINIKDNELVYKDPLDGYVFGRKYEYRLELVANDNNQSNYQSPSKHIEGEFHLGETFAVNNYKQFLYNELSDQLYALSINDAGAVYIDELNANTLALVKRHLVTNSNNTIGDFSFNKDKNFIIDLNTKSIEVNSASFKIIKEYNISAFNNQALTYSTIVRFRKNTFAIDNIENHKQVFVYDIPSKELLVETHRLKNYAFKISADGNYFNVNKNMYKKTNTTLSNVFTEEFGREFYADYSTATNKAYIATGFIKEVNLLTSSVYQIPYLSNIDRVDYIPSQGKILALLSGYYLVFYDLNSNQENIKVINIQGDSYFYLAQKNFLISPNGYVIKNYQ